jgi:hypothetical protein
MISQDLDSTKCRHIRVEAAQWHQSQSMGPCRLKQAGQGQVSTCKMLGDPQLPTRWESKLGLLSIQASKAQILDRASTILRKALADKTLALEISATARGQEPA